MFLIYKSTIYDPPSKLPFICIVSLFESLSDITYGSLRDEALFMLWTAAVEFFFEPNAFPVFLFEVCLIGSLRMETEAEC